MSIKPRIGFLGPGPFTNGFTVALRFASHVTGRKGGFELCEMRSYDTHQDVIDAKARNEIDYGIIAVENTLDSLITESIREIERLFEQDLPARPFVCWEELLPIRHLFLHQTGDLRQVTKISSHQSALRQCSRFLLAIRKAFPNIELVQAKSTGAAVQDALTNPGVAALASTEAAEATREMLVEVNLEVARQNNALEWDDPKWITDFRNGMTRFWVLGNAPMQQIHGRSFMTTVKDSAGQIVGTVDHSWQKTCVLLNLPNKRGTLHEALRVFDKHGTFLSIIHPYPRLMVSFEYLFFAEVEGHCDDPSIKAAVAELNRHHMNHNERERPCIVLGSYPNTILLNQHRAQRDAFRRESYPADMVWKD
ncbi:MAG: chorismate mutase [Verrucomicrobiaceae bacterium]|nr:chorismate mutase [Verrucomicrobiaceae bacterium]